MAEPSSNEVAAPAQAPPGSSVGQIATATTGSSAPLSSSDTTSSSFRPVTASAAELNMASPATGQGSATSKPTPREASVAADKSRTKQLASSNGISDTKSSLAAIDNLDGAADTSTYGTRSRNRTGNARPNYAEDQDAEFEVPAATTKKKAAAAAAAAANDHVSTAAIGGEGKRAPDAARFVAINNSSNANNNNLGAIKESTPTSTGPAAASKKRKAGHGPTTAATASAAPTGATTSRKAAASTAARETNLMTFTKHKARLNAKGELVADDGTKLCVNDHVYLVCEPPGDPYYLCRIMEFLHVRSDDLTSPIDALRVNWYYRPRDVQRFNSDSRLVYGTMHSDICPITSLRGKCTIRHRSEISDLDAYRKERDSFYFVQVFDRFIRRWYECVPVAQIINVPGPVKKALDERWKFVVIEPSRLKELTSAVKTCKRCGKYCASHDSVDCAICKNSYHMNCVQPPLPKKPSRGFAWACAPCSRASERKLEQKQTPNASGNVTEAEEEEVVEEEQPSASNESTRAPSPNGSDMDIDLPPATEAEIALAKMWPMRYLGIHARVEDALQYDDRAIYPRASSRLGPRHQANVNVWHGRPVELVKPAEIKKRYNKAPGAKKGPQLSKEAMAALEAEREERAKRPKWVQDEPPGYVARGEDYPNDDPRNTARLLFDMPSAPPASKSEGTDGSTTIVRTEAQLDEFVKNAKTYARGIGVPPFGANFLDKTLQLLTKYKFDKEAATKRLARLDRVRDLHEPVLSRPEVVKFEEGVAKYGSEHRLVHQHMETDLPISTIIRFYYLWKKTPKGRDIWGNYGGRKGSKRKVENDAGAQLQASVAHDADDSAFDYDKAVKKSRSFICKFCDTTHSRQWRRAPFVSAGQCVASDGKHGKEKGKQLLLALCLRCAGLWRKYAIQWEDIDEVSKKVGQGGGKAWKKRIDEELLREILAANEANKAPTPDPTAAAVPSIEAGEPPKKKSKTDAAAADPPKKKEKPLPPPKEPTPPPPPIVPDQPIWRELPCAVCKEPGRTIECGHCRLTVHRQCFGLPADEGVQANGEVRWICEQCQNDRAPLVSTDYACCLCLTEETQVDLVEMPRGTHKKKTDRDREKERMEKELADAMREDYRNRQQLLHRPTLPREPLKRTTGNNWVHVYCAVWTPEIRFSDAKALEVSEGFQQIPLARFDAVCKLCKNKDHQNRARDDKGSCVACFQCHTNFHVSCAFEAGYVFGFDVTPVKGSRKDQIATATLGEETGSLTAGIWCKEHVIKTNVHPLHEIADPETGKTALQVFVENFKQADLTLTGTVRKANMVQSSKDKGQQSTSAAAGISRRESTVTNGIAAAVRRGARNSSIVEAKPETDYGATQLADTPEARRCAKCNIDVTPKWHVVTDFNRKEPTPPRSPHRQTSAALPEYADQQRERSNSNEQANQGNIRFMAPGANGRAWDGMVDRSGPRPLTNGHVGPNEHPLAGTVQLMREGHGPSGHPEAHHSHSLPRYRQPTSNHDPPPPHQARPRIDHLCHRCFVKRKLDPSPPPEERSSTSPHHTPAPSADWPGTKTTSSGFDHAKPIRMPHDEPPRPEPQPAPSAPAPAPIALSGPYNPGPPQTYPQYAHTSPTYHAPAPSQPPQSQLAGPAPMHERRGSFGFSAPLTPSNPTFSQFSHSQPGSAQPQPPRASPFHGFPPPGHPQGHHQGHPPLPNGLGSPPATAYGSPGHGTHPPYPAFPPRRPEEHVSTQLPPLGMPAHQPTPYRRTPPPAQHQHQYPPPPHHHPQHSPHLSHLPPQHAQPAYQHPPSAQPPPPHHALPSPHTSQPRPPSRGGPGIGDGRGGTPGGSGGASTSPSLNNLLH